MRVNLGVEPPVLSFFEGADKFSLTLKPLTGTEKMRVFHAVSTSNFEMIEAATQDVVTDWSGVKDEHGRVIPFKSKDDKGRTTHNLDAFMGAISLMQQFEVTLGIVASIGLPEQLLAETLHNLKRAVGKELDLDPTSKPDCATPKPASGGSSSSDKPPSG